MKLITAVTLVAFLTPSTMANAPYMLNTVCYNFFDKKDGCVYAAADGRTRCDAGPKEPPKEVCQIAPPKPPSFNQGYARLAKREEPHRLQRRYDATSGVFPVLGGSGICGYYDTNEQHGACLWSGASQDGSNPATAGWLNGAQTSNCGKKLYIQRQGQPSTVLYVPIIDGCSFDTCDENVGCFQIALTNATFNALCPTDEEVKAQAITGITWDFDNLHGCHPKDAPI